MGRRYQNRRRKTSRETAPQDALHLILDRREVVALLRGALQEFSTKMGWEVAVGLLKDEVLQLCGRRHARWPNRTMSRHGHQPGWVTVAGQKLPLERPRVRYTDGRGEVALANYGLLQQEEALPEAVLRRMLRGVSTRNYEGVVDLAREGFGVRRSSVSRAFTQATARSLRELTERRFEGVRFLVIYLDGVEVGGETLVVALGVDEGGGKHLLGLRQGATENAEVCTALLEELCERGVATDVPTLFVIDGSKALRSAIRRVWGRFGVVQRCQVHKRRNVRAHLPKRHWAEVSRRLSAAYQEGDYERARRLLKTTVAWLERLNPDAAASLREGLEETLTVLRLGIPATLRKTLCSTNPVESALSVGQGVIGRVKRWRGGGMRLRWCAAALLHAERQFRRVRGYRQLGVLSHALQAAVTLQEGERAQQVA